MSRRPGERRAALALGRHVVMGGAGGSAMQLISGSESIMRNFTVGKAVRLAICAGLVGAGVVPLHGQLATSSGSAQSSAQPTTGRLPAWEKSSLNQRSPAILLLYHAAVCFQQRYRAQALALLETGRGSEDERRIYNELVEASNRAIDSGHDHLVCFLNPAASQPNVGTGKVRFGSKGLLRGAIAEAFYNRQRVRSRGSASLPLDDDWTRFAARGNPQTATEQREVVASWTAMCAAHASPSLVHRILNDNPGDVRETRALRALEPTFLRFLPPGESLRVERLTMRTLLGEGLLRASQTHRAKFHNA